MIRSLPGRPPRTGAEFPADFVLARRWLAALIRVGHLARERRVPREAPMWIWGQPASPRGGCRAARRARLAPVGGWLGAGRAAQGGAARHPRPLRWPAEAVSWDGRVAAPPAG